MMASQISISGCDGVMRGMSEEGHSCIYSALFYCKSHRLCMCVQTFQVALSLDMQTHCPFTVFNTAGYRSPAARGDSSLTGNNFINLMYQHNFKKNSSSSIIKDLLSGISRALRDRLPHFYFFLNKLSCPDASATLNLPGLHIMDQGAMK